MASPSLEYFNSVFQYVPQGHEKALKQAFYNTAANIFILFACAALIAVYFILNPFLRPLCWAVLCGTFLYPFKRSLTNVLKKWLNGLRTSDTPFAVGLVILPVQVVNNSTNTLLNMIRNNYYVVGGFLLGMPVLQFMYYYGVAQKIFYFCLGLLNFCHDITAWFSSMWLWTIFIGYIVTVIFFWTEESRKTFHYISITVWVTLILHIATVAGPLRLLLLAALVVVMVIGFVSEASKESAESEATEKPEEKQGGTLTSEPWKSIFDKDSAGQDVKVSQPPASTQKPQSLSLASKPTTSTPTKVAKQQDTPTEEGSQSLSNQCFVALFWGHVLVRLWIHVWGMILILFLPLLLLIIRGLAGQFSSGGFLHERMENVKKRLIDWYAKREDAIAPRSISGLAKIALKGDKKVIDALEVSTDKATSILLILILLIGSMLFIIIGAIQIHQESIHMVTVTSNLFNEKVNPEISQWLPNSTDMEKAMDSMAENAYIYGRDYIASMVHSLVDAEGQNNTELEVRVLEVWDQLYQSWFAKNTTQVARPSSPGFPDITNMTAMWDMVSQGDGLFNVGSLVSFAQDNVGTFMSVFESIWLVIKGNMDLMMNIVTAILSMVLGGGTAILNFIISAILFLTTLFYLLASSGNQYKPLEWFSSMSPAGSQGGGSKMGGAVEEAISGVFMASLKMASFYGLFTWLTHLVFGVNIVFIPSALAAIFGAIPFVGTYWAAFPAMLELWLGQGQGVMAILLFIVHMLPAYVVDTAIYSEIKGGHPFMTGLAIAGGMYCLGLEGAIIGPIVLCFLVVIVNIYGTMMQPDPSTPQGGPRVAFRHPMSQSRHASQWNVKRSVSSDTVKLS
ncbi:transmembrane protein 245-like isoform X1 [Haliotis cracherodii]|uniref:transmembrane protein 245-like isoform X1 n=1 Tax=Haliotis cracherodii TaxID=6455 RepID=UPI0039EABFB5